MNFHRLVTPVFIAVAVSIAAFIAVVIVAAKLQDDAALTAEAKVATQDILSVHQSLAILAEDNAWWDDAVRRISLNEDIEWIDTTIGESVNSIREIKGVLIMRPDASLIYSNFVEDLPSPHKLMGAAFEDLVTSLPAPDPVLPTSRSGIVYVEDELIAFGASRVHTSGIEAFEDSVHTQTHPTIIFLSRLDPALLDTMGQENAIEGLRFSRQMPEGPQAALKDFRGDPIGFLNWKTKAPGSKMIEKMILPAIVLLVLITIAMMRFVRQANALIGELESANRSKSAFLASTSHEIRTPLNAILGFTELISLELYGKVEGEKNKEYLRHIRESGEHLLSIINDILDISKLEADKFDIYAEKVDPLLVIKASQKIVQAAADEKNIEITTDCAPAELYSDERIMRQVLINLFSNAVKFTPGGGHIAVSGALNGAFYKMVIADNGVGMSEAEIQTAMDLFGQVQSEYARNHTGTGLGLPLVCRFMELLGGTFLIKSTKGEGTTITLEFPLYTHRRDAKKT